LVVVCPSVLSEQASGYPAIVLCVMSHYSPQCGQLQTWNNYQQRGDDRYNTRVYFRTRIFASLHIGYRRTHTWLSILYLF
jgi:hypothetical protein